jgi:hypothetical protein
LNGKERENVLNSNAAEKWWIGGRRADGSERYYPIAPLRYAGPEYVPMHRHQMCCPVYAGDLEINIDGRRCRSTDRNSL